MDLKIKPDGILFKIIVLPKSAKNQIQGVHDGALKIKLTAPPVDGAANKMCLKFLAKILKTAPSRLKIISGKTNKHKSILWETESSPPTQNEMKFLKKALTPS